MCLLFLFICYSHLLKNPKHSYDRSLSVLYKAKTKQKDFLKTSCVSYKVYLQSLGNLQNLII